MAAARAVGKLSAESTALFVCDLQELFRPLIHEMPTVLRTSGYLIRAAHCLNVPIIATEQYPKAFKNTVPEIQSALTAAGAPVFEKTQFSMLTPEVREAIGRRPLTSAIIVGIETCLDLLEMGVDVHLPLDAISSQRAHDRAAALERMKQSGAYLTSAESLIFMLLKDAKHPGFRDVQRLIKEHNAGEQCRL